MGYFNIQMIMHVLTFAWQSSRVPYWWRPSYCLLLSYHVLPESAGTARAHSPPETGLKRSQAKTAS